MQHLEGSGTPVLYIGRTVLKVKFLSPPSSRTAMSNFNDTLSDRQTDRQTAA